MTRFLNTSFSMGAQNVFKTFAGSPVINGKEPHHEGHQVHKGGESLDFMVFSFVTVVSFVFERVVTLKR